MGILIVALGYAQAQGQTQDQIKTAINAYFQESPSVIAANEPLKIYFDPKAAAYPVGFASYDAATNILTLTLNSKVLQLDIRSFRTNKEMLLAIDATYCPETIFITSTFEEKIEDRSPKIILVKSKAGDPSGNLNTTSVTGIAKNIPTLITFGPPSNFNDGKSRVEIIRHYDPDKPIADNTRQSAPAVQRLAAVSNNKAELIIDNLEISTKSGTDGTIKIAASTVLKEKDGSLTEKREVDYVNTGSDKKGVFEVFTQSVASKIKLIVRFFTTFTFDNTMDRGYKTGASVNDVVITKSSDVWSDTNLATYSDCNEKTIDTCPMVIQDGVTCFCTFVNGIYGYRNQNNELCNIFKNPVAKCENGEKDSICAPFKCKPGEVDADCTYKLTDKDKGYNCCTEKNCNAVTGAGVCTKMGFMMLPGTVGQDQLLKRIPEFVGKGGKGNVLLVGFTGKNAVEMADMVTKADALKLTPILRLMGPNWGSTTPTVKQMSDFVKEVRDKSGGKLKYVQVWNEPNIIYKTEMDKNNYFENPEVYAKYVVDFKKELNDPSIKIIPAALSWGSLSEQSDYKKLDSRIYFTKMMDYPNFLDSIDYMAYHSYDDAFKFDKEDGTCLQGSDIVVPEYMPKLCDEGILGYKFVVNAAKKKGKDFKVMITEFGYRRIGKNTFETDSTYSFKKENMVKAMEFMQKDPNVEFVSIFLLNGFDAAWHQDSWAGLETKAGEGPIKIQAMFTKYGEYPPLPHTEEISNLACGGYGGAAKTTIPNRKFEILCKDGTKDNGEFSASPDIKGVKITQLEYSGDKKCKWTAVVKKLKCEELNDISKGIYARVYSENYDALTQQPLKFQGVSNQLVSLEKHPYCGDERKESAVNQKVGWLYLDYPQAQDKQELSVYKENAASFNSDVVEFDMKTLESLRCGATDVKIPVYVRFIKDCKE